MGNKTDTVLYGAELIRLPGFICDFFLFLFFGVTFNVLTSYPAKRRRIPASRGLRRLTPPVSALKRKKEMGGGGGGGWEEKHSLHFPLLPLTFRSLHAR